jgi:glycolate oxidase
MIAQESIEQLKSIVGPNNYADDFESLNNASSDYTEDLSFPPELVLFPSDAAQISEILKLCNVNRIPVYTRGAGTGLSGACLPVNGGIALSTKNLNQILNIDTDNFQVTVEPGVVNQHLKQALEPHGFTYPPDPASMGSSTIGGNIAHGAGGPKAVKYGTTRDYVLNLEIVLPNGDIIWTGANTLKNSTGFTLTHLMVGSEGMLGIITKAVLKITPKVDHELLMLISFDQAETAAKTVSEILKNGFKPSGIELMERNGIDIVLKHKNLQFPQTTEDAFYMLLVLEGDSQGDLMNQAESIYPFFENQGALNVYIPNNADMANDWWSARRSIGELVKQQSIYKEEDTVVPRSKLPELLRVVKDTGVRYGFRSVCYGHAGDGNLHINILKDNMSEENWKNEVPKGIRKIFEYCQSVGGTISGEHGVGFVQKDFLDVVMTPTHFHLLKGIKHTFDPNGILNPGKWID